MCLKEVEREKWIGFFWLGIGTSAAAGSHERGDGLLFSEFFDRSCEAFQE
jgi:hypothetical protein